VKVGETKDVCGYNEAIGVIFKIMKIKNIYGCNVYGIIRKTRNIKMFWDILQQSQLLSNEKWVCC
jgi:hypothetical protein